MWENNFLKQNSQHRVIQNRGFCKIWKKQQDTKKKHNGIGEKEFV